MFKFLFNRSAPLVRLLEAVGIVNSCFLLKSPLADSTRLLYLFLLTGYLWIRVCDFIPWHRKEQSSFWQKDIGLRVHFQKALVPVSYILAIVSSVCLLKIELLSFILLVLAAVCMLIITPVNGILIWFHFKDKEALPINYFSHNKHLK